MKIKKKELKPLIDALTNLQLEHSDYDFNIEIIQDNGSGWRWCGYDMEFSKYEETGQ